MLYWKYVCLLGLLGSQGLLAQPVAQCALKLASPRLIFPRVELIFGNYNFESYQQARPLRSSTDPNSYESVAMKGLVPDLYRLGSEDIWLDAGAGEMQAIYEYFKSKNFADAARVIAVVEKMSPNSTPLKKIRSRMSTQGFYPVVGQTIEAIDWLPAESLSLITDIYGAAAYTRNLDAVLRQYLSWLKVGGNLYITLGRTDFVYFLKTVRRRKFKLFGPLENRREWWKRRLWTLFDQIEGIEYQATAFENGYLVHIQKLDSKIKMPPLKTESYVDYHPPLRGFTIR